MKRVALVLSGLMLAVLTLACSGDGDIQVPGVSSGASSATGPGISIQEAMTSDLQGPLLINGFLFIEGKDVRFCSALAESSPPQCVGESLKVEGVDLSQVAELQQADGIRWSEEMQLLGEIEGNSLKVRQNAIS